MSSTGELTRKCLSSSSKTRCNGADGSELWLSFLILSLVSCSFLSTVSVFSRWTDRILVGHRAQAGFGWRTVCHTWSWPSCMQPAMSSYYLVWAASWIRISWHSGGPQWGVRVSANQESHVWRALFFHWDKCHLIKPTSTSMEFDFI